MLVFGESDVICDGHSMTQAQHSTPAVTVKVMAQVSVKEQNGISCHGKVFDINGNQCVW